ncbi:Cyclin, N-terminal domain-containing protein [Suillus cothurnatus]|nr:Cyclin, N-terminal domain-containing protein [Suillus cothurnatus]
MTKNINKNKAAATAAKDGNDHPPAPEPSRRVSTHRSGANTQEVQRVQAAQRTSSHLVSKTETQEEVQDNHNTDIDEQVQHEAEVVAVLDVDVAPEADPDGDKWDDVDAEDSDDPLMSANMLSRSSTYARFRLLPETLFLRINIVDRFLSARVVSPAKLQLVGITCLSIASKVEEIVAPSISHLLHCADSSYTESDILLAERYVLKTIDWNSSYPNPMHFLYRMDNGETLEWRLLATPPSLVGRFILGNDKWTPNHACLSSYVESSIIPTANLILNHILKPICHESFYKKYAGKRLDVGDEYETS